MGKTKDAIKSAKASNGDAGSKSTKGGSAAPSKAQAVKGGKAKSKPVDESSGSETSDSSESSESDSESEAEVAPKAAKSNGKTNGKAKAAKAESEDDSDDDSGSSEEESDSEDEKPAAKPVKANGAKQATKKAEQSDSDDDSEGSSDEESDEEKPVKAASGNKAAGKASKASESEGSDDSEDDSEDSDESMEDVEEQKEAPKKRKADEESASPTKKSRVEDDSRVSANLFVGSLSWNVDNDMLAETFGVYGTLKRVHVMTDHSNGRSKGFGYVEFEEAADAQKAYENLKDTELDGRTINLDYAKPQAPRDGATRDFARAKQYGDQLSEPSSTLFVGNVSFEADEQMLSEAFSEYGTLTGVRLPTDPDSGSLKGYGYVEFSSVAEATAALEAMKGYNLAGRSLRLDYSTPRAGRGGGGGFNDRGGRGGGRGRGGFNDRGRGGRGGGRGGFNDRGRGRGGRGTFSTNRGGFGDFKGNRQTFD